jgi:hypothetical protein
VKKTLMETVLMTVTLTSAAVVAGPEAALASPPHICVITTPGCVEYTIT